MYQLYPALLLCTSPDVILPLPYAHPVLAAIVSQTTKNVWDDSVNVERPKMGAGSSRSKAIQVGLVDRGDGLRQSKPRTSRQNFLDEFAFKEGFPQLTPELPPIRHSVPHLIPLDACAWMFSVLTLDVTGQSAGRLAH